MPIIFDERRKVFKLDTAASSYVFQIFEQNYLVHLYYGAKIPDTNIEYMAKREYNASFSASDPILGEPHFSQDVYPMEYSCNGTGDMRVTALAIKNRFGNTATDIRYVSHRIFGGKPPLEGLPALFAEETQATTLEVEAIDSVTGARVFLLYTVFEEYGAMTRSVRVENSSEYPFDIERVLSLNLDFPTMDYNMLHLYGCHNRERTLSVQPLHHGNQSIGSLRGASSNAYNPFVALMGKAASEDFGEAYGFNFVYSGNFTAQAEVDFNDATRFVMGINPTDFNWRLNPNESFTAPEVVMVYSNEGLGGMSRTFHRLYNNHLIDQRWNTKVKRPLLINSWEAAYFDFDDEKLVAFAKQAKELGIEMLVMDDGWFGHRDNDKSSLGDWYVNESKLKGGLSSLIERVNNEGLKFGIWYEPEMISPDSDLYRAHPDWCLHVPERTNCPGRWQYVLDMSRADVRDNIFEQMSSVLKNNNIAYVKWDFNRNLTNVGSALLPADRQQEVFHRFVLGTYELLDRLREAFPDILLESCSGGGGRFDPAMLYYSPQIWCSDNTDALERLTIQYGTSMCYPASTVGSHVSMNERTGLRTKANVALSGTFGYELDPVKLDDEQKAEIKEQVKLYHKYYDIIHSGDLYRVISPYDDRHRCAWGYVTQDKSEALFTFVVYQRTMRNTRFAKLKGLDPNKYYMDDFTGDIHSGAALMNVGLNLIDRPRNDGDSYLIHLKEAKK